MGFAGIGVGAAFNGLRPIVEFMTFNFAMQAIDQIVNSAAKTLYMSNGQIHCPIVFRGPNGAPGGVAAQHSQCFASWYAHCPGLKVVAPYTADDAYRLLRAAIRDENPVIFLEHEKLYGRNFEIKDKPNEPVLLNRAIIMREGSNITITAFSISLDYVLEAAVILQEQYGISVEVINLVSLNPIDRETIVNSVKKTGRIINVEEGWESCGIGAEVISIVVKEAFDYLDSEPTRICSADIPAPYSQNLEKHTFPSVDKIVSTALNLCNVSYSS
jgi:pyruvate dehydrogenase E1 component beta subunit